MKPEQMIKKVYPALLEEIEKTENALEVNQKWLNENILTENEKNAGRLLVESNKEARLKSALDELNNKLSHAEREAAKYWTVHHKAEVAADGMKPIKDTLDSLEILKGVSGIQNLGISQFSGALKKVLVERESDIKMLEHTDKSSPYSGVLVKIKES